MTMAVVYYVEGRSSTSLITLEPSFGTMIIHFPGVGITDFVSYRPIIDLLNFTPFTQFYAAESDGKYFYYYRVPPLPARRTAQTNRCHRWERRGRPANSRPSRQQLGGGEG